jgi:predicted enzyme related to lactoylglutathione lyase
MVLVAVACGDGAQSPSTDPTFTGEVKPVLYVTDVEASAPFFRDVLGFHFLGFSTLDGAPYYAEMSAGSLKFGLHEPMTAEQETWVGHQRIYFRVRDLRAQRDRVVAAGGAPGEIVETDWMDMFIVRDPAGHEIVFAATDLSKHTMDPW